MKILMQTNQMHQTEKIALDEQNYFDEKFVREQTSSYSIKLDFFLYFYFDQKKNYFKCVRIFIKI